MKITATWCMACGEVLPDEIDFRTVQKRHRKFLHHFCEECVLDMVDGVIPKDGTLQKTTGGGRRVIRESKTH